MSTLMHTPTVTETCLSDPDIHSVLTSVLSAQRSGVLGTCFMDIPLCSQMAFAVTEDLRAILVVTPRQSSKFDNMTANPNVSFLVTTARNNPDDPAQAMALTATGWATELVGEDRHAALSLFVARHPELRAFAFAATSAIMEIRVDSYDVVRNFQNVTHVRQA